MIPTVDECKLIDDTLVVFSLRNVVLAIRIPESVYSPHLGGSLGLQFDLNPILAAYAYRVVVRQS
ncbi:hypothetical protein ASG82_12295 [Mycobacterium sp. Soil538]|nr:hypothetical protein ASG82_12295 [Mycobacterium sp. Soil538]